MRKENKKLKNHLNGSIKNSQQPSPINSSNNNTLTATRNVVNRVNAFLDRSNRLNTLSRLIGSNNNNSLMMSSGSSSGIFNNPRNNSTIIEIKQGAKERLSSPPPLLSANQKVLN